MKQAALANKPDVPLAILDDTGEPPNRLAIAVSAVMSEGLASPGQTCPVRYLRWRTRDSRDCRGRGSTPNRR